MKLLIIVFLFSNLLFAHSEGLKCTGKVNHYKNYALVKSEKINFSVQAPVIKLVTKDIVASLGFKSGTNKQVLKLKLESTNGASRKKITYLDPINKSSFAYQNIEIGSDMIRPREQLGANGFPLDDHHPLKKRQPAPYFVKRLFNLSCSVL